MANEESGRDIVKHPGLQSAAGALARGGRRDGSLRCLRERWARAGPASNDNQLSRVMATRRCSQSGFLC